MVGRIPRSVGSEDSRPRVHLTLSGVGFGVSSFWSGVMGDSVIGAAVSVTDLSAGSSVPSATKTDPKNFIKKVFYNY